MTAWKVDRAWALFYTHTMKIDEILQTIDAEILRLEQAWALIPQEPS
jgi:hypothetical protein